MAAAAAAAIQRCTAGKSILGTFAADKALRDGLEQENVKAKRLLGSGLSIGVEILHAKILQHYRPFHTDRTEDEAAMRDACAAFRGIGRQ